MATDALTLVCDKLKHAAFVGFRGKEMISRPYELELFFTVPIGTSAKDAVGTRAKLEIARAEGVDPVVFHGVIAGMRLLHQTAERALYRALLVPRLWMLRHFRRSNVFTFKTLKDFLGETLEDGGLLSSEYRFAIDPGAYPEEEFVAQYRESHLDFFHRWLEREGLYYYFEHKPDADGEVLVIVDDKGQHEAFPGTGRVRYFPTFGGDAAVPLAIHHLETDTHWLPKSLTIEDYDYGNPSAPLVGESAVSSTGLGVIHEYGYRVFGDKDVKRLATVRAQAIGCRASTMRAEGDALGPRAGYKLSIDDRPEDLEETWLAVEVEHSGSMSGWTPEMARLTGLTERRVYHASIFAVPASVQYRAPQSTPWPRVYGLENGIVGGPADSQYAQIDADGRYLVRFQFDQSDLGDAKVSTRIRMLQPHGGETEGFHFPLRKNTEVMVAFLGGDPDRPFIAGVVPNAQKPSVVGERNHTQNIIRTGSNNQLVMEDDEGKEFIFMHTPNNMTGIYMGAPAGAHAKVYTGDGERTTTRLFRDPGNADPSATEEYGGSDVSLYPHTDGNAGSYIGGESWQEVGGIENIYVQGAVSHGYRSTFTFKVGSDATENYYATRTTTVKSGRTDTVEAGGWVQNITDKLHQTVTGSGWQHVTAAWKHDVDGENHDDYGSWKTDVAHDWTATLGGKMTATVASDVKIESTGGAMKLKASSKIDLEAPQVTVKGAKIKTDSGDFFGTTGNKHEFYFYKGASGVLKTDHAALYQSLYGLKLDTAGIKVENEGAKKLTYGAIFRTIGFAQRVGGLSLRTVGVLIWNGTFAKK